MSAWDRQPARSLSVMQDDLLRRQIQHSIAPLSPLWERRFEALGRDPSTIRTVSDLAAIAAIGERDVSPNGDPAAMLSLVLRPRGAGSVPRATRARPRRSMPALLRRDDATEPEDGRATSYVFSGLGFGYPLASTRSDLDVVSRAGARLWAVLGLTRDDTLLSAVAPAATTEHVALERAALAAGASAMFPGPDPASLAAAARLVPPTVVAVPAVTAPEVLEGLSGTASVRTLLLVGAPTDAERVAAADALFRAGGPSDTAILAVHAPAGARLLWGECRASEGATGLHTYPDLEIVQAIDADTGQATRSTGEVVLTQLGMQGSAMVRWRTGDVAAAITSQPCPACGRTVPRVEGLRRYALVIQLDSGRMLDLRSVAGVLAARPDLRDWRIVVSRRERDGGLATVIHFEGIDPSADASTVIAVATDMRHLTGMLPAQFVAASRQDLAALGGDPVSARILVG